jgi:glutamine synthetase type III
MNLKLIQWLLANQTALLKVVEIAKHWKNDASYSEKWALVDSIARVLMPVIETTVTNPKMLCSSYNVTYDERGGVSTMSFPDPKEVNETEAHALAINVDWKLLCDVILPLVISILQAISDKSK